MSTTIEDLQAELSFLYEQMENAMTRNNSMALEIELLKVELDQIFNGSADGMWVIDTDYRFQRINQVMAKLLDGSPGEMLGRTCHDLLQCGHKGSEKCPMYHLLRGESRCERDTHLDLPSGHSIPVIKTATPFVGIDGDVIGILVTVKDITERHRASHQLEQANRKLQRLATIDGLTQVSNRRQFDHQLKTEWRRMHREGTALSLVLCDIDYFKRYNDSLGHQEGDTCLKKVAQALNGGVRRAADLVARYGGEEFVVLLPNTPGEGARIVAENLRSTIQELNLAHPDSPVSEHVTLSMGISSASPNSNFSSEELVTRADKAMYQAKSQGRDRVVLLQETPDQN
jgi:diguanylate cyclase (GGDEF)-like protein/PAS domain S-box-containing protein